MPYALPSRVPSYLLRLYHQYARTNPVLHELVGHSRWLIDEAVAHDNWNGGMDGHAVRLFVPVETLAKIDIDDQLSLASGMRDEMTKLTSGFDKEYISAISFEMEDEGDRDCQCATPFSKKSTVTPEQAGVWSPGLVRLFISHRDGHKSKAHQLAGELSGYGFSCFVAHDTIPTNEEWRKVIVSALETMEVMLVFLTDDFSESVWTMQEVGYALGKGVPYVSLKLESRDPPGFISHKQALRGSLDAPETSAGELAGLIGRELGQANRLQTALVISFTEARSFIEAKDRFELMSRAVTKLTEDEVRSLREAYRSNDQLHGSIYLSSRNRLSLFLKQATGRSWRIEGRTIAPVEPE